MTHGSLFKGRERENVIGTKWVYKNKLNEQGQLMRNKARLFCKGYDEIEGVDFKETFAPVTRLEAIRIFIALAIHKNIKVYQMDLTFAFLNGYLEEEVYIEHLEGFLLTSDDGLACKLKKSMYGLK